MLGRDQRCLRAKEKAAEQYLMMLPCTYNTRFASTSTISKKFIRDQMYVESGSQTDACVCWMKKKILKMQMSHETHEKGMESSIPSKLSPPVGHHCNNCQVDFMA